MKKNVSNILLLFILFSIFLIYGCYYGYSDHRRSARHEETAPKPPREIKILLNIQNWRIINNRILDYEPEWGKLRFDGKYIYLDKLVIKITSSVFPEYFWMAIVPEVENGEYKISARRMKVEAVELQEFKPPHEFTIKLVIENKVVAEHAIINPHPGWGVFQVDDFKDGILYLKNDFYPKCIWAIKMPRKDGKWTIQAILQNEGECCHEE